jgi:hypothetical protein
MVQLILTFLLKHKQNSGQDDYPEQHSRKQKNMEHGGVTLIWDGIINLEFLSKMNNWW